MSETPFIANLPEVDSPVPLLNGGFTFSPEKLDQNPEDEPKSSARLRLLKSDTLEDRRSSGSRRSSAQQEKSPKVQRKSIPHDISPLMEGSPRRASKFRDSGEGLALIKRNSLLKKTEVHSPSKRPREKGVRNPARTRSRKELQEPSSLTSKSGSEIFDVQNLYLKQPVDSHSLAATPSKRVNRSRNTFIDAAQPSQSHVKDLYYRMLKKRFAQTTTQKREDPSEFSEQVEEIKNGIRPPNEERLRDLVILEKTDLERARIYTDTLPFLKQRKKMFIFIRYISLICFKIINHPLFDYFILSIILTNSILLALDDPTDVKPAVPETIDNLFLGIYTLEMVLKILGMGFLFRKNSYLRDWWNVMDFIIVVTAYIPMFVSGNGVNLKAFRALRVLRPLRTISNVESLRILILTLLAAFYPLLDTLFILVFFLLIFAIGGLQLFGGLMKKRCFSIDEGIPLYADEASSDNQKYCNTDNDCGTVDDIEYICGKMISNPNYGVTNFDTIVASLLMVFQAITLEGWSDMMYILQKTFSPLSVVYFVMLIIIGSFFLLNLTLAVIKAEFSAYSHDSKGDENKARKYWTHAEKLFEKLELYKGEVLTLIDKYTKSLVRFNKYELKKENWVALEGRHARRMSNGVYKRRRNNAKHPSLSRLEKIKNAIIQKLSFKNVAKKGFATLVSIARFISLQSIKTENIQPNEQKNGSKNEFSASGKSSGDIHAISLAAHNGNASPMTDTPKKPLLSLSIQSPTFSSSERLLKNAPRTNNFHDKTQKPSEQNGKILPDNSSKMNRNELHPDRNQTPSLVVIPSIAEAHENSEQSAIASSISSKNFLPIQRNNFLYGKIGSKSPKSPIRPRIDQKIRVQSEDQQRNEDIALINIAGIRNKKRGKTQKLKPKSRLEFTPMATPEPRDPSLSGDKSPFDFSDIQEPEKPQQSNNMMRTNQIFMQMNQINKPLLRNARSTVRKSTKKAGGSGILPSIFDLGEQINDLDKDYKDLEEGIPTDILDDSDFLDEHQRFELLRKKKLDRFMRKPTYGARSPNKRSTSNILGSMGSVNNLNHPHEHRNSQLKHKKDTFVSTDLQQATTAELEDEEDDQRYIIDVRNLKPEPKFEREYEAISLEDVLPSKKEMELRKIEEEEQRNIRNAHLKIQFKVTAADMKKAQTKLESDYGKESTHSLAVQHSKRAKRIKQQKLEEEALDNQLSKAMFSKDNQPPSLRQSLNRNTTKNYLKKKTVFSTGGHGHGTGQGATSNRGALQNQINEDDYLPPEKMNDYIEVLARIEKPFDNETEGQEHKILKDFSLDDYKDIRRKDLSTNVIQERNWSGDNVLGRTNALFPIAKTKRALNLQDYDIWRPGFLGVIHAFRRLCRKITESDAFNTIIMLSVLFNTIVLGTEGLVKDADTQAFLSDLNFTFTIIFTIELTLKVTALGVIKYARDKMNLFDAAIVAISLVEEIFLSGGSNKAVSAFRTIRLFRTFRVLRVTKLLRSLSYMKVVIGVIMRSMKNFVYILLLLFLFLFIYSLLGMQIYGGNMDMPDNVGVTRVRQNFNSFFDAFMTSFQIMSQENWNSILYLAMRSPGVSNIISLAYLVSWIFVGNYIFLNLFFAILLDEFTGEDTEEELEEIEEEMEDDDSHGVTRTSMSQTLGGKLTSQQKSLSKDSYTAKSSISKIEGEISDDGSMSDSKHAQKKENIACRKSFYIFSKQNIIRKICLAIIHHRYFEKVILTMIILSSIKLALDSYISELSDVWQARFLNVDKFFTIFFAIEAFIKIISLGFVFDKGSYLRDAWNKLDFIIVCASLLDMSIEQVQLGFIKILRLLRTLRPLRFITHNTNMRLIVTALLESVTAIINVLIVVLMIWLMFAILAVNIVGGKMGTCTNLPGDLLPYGINETECIELGYIWKIPNVNFDNVFSAMLSLFIVSTQEGWPDIMYTVVDSNDATEGPKEGANKLFAFAFFLVYMFVGSFFLVNLFIGVILLEFTRAQKRENFVAKFLTPAQQNWVVMQRLVVGVKPDVSNVEPEPKWMKKIFRVINNTRFDIAIMCIIILNIVSMGCTFEGASDGYNLALKYINWTFSGIFVVELILKHLGLGIKRYWSIGWNQFDAFVVLASALDITMDFLQQSFLSVLRVGPQIARVFRVLRVSRLFKLVKQFEGLQKMINTLVFSLPALLNVGALLFLVYFIFSILATFLYSDIERGAAIDDYANFKTFLSSIVTLFRCSTGENWFVIMFDTLYPEECVVEGANCNTDLWAGLAFWLSFIVICQFIFLNLFVLVILEQFEQYHLNPDNPINKFREALEDVFIPHWESYSLKHGGTHIHVAQLHEFFRTLPKPLGFKGTDLPKKEIAKEIMQMNILPDTNSMIFYNDVIYAAFRRGFNTESITEFAQYQYLLKEEQKTRRKLEGLKKKSSGNLFQMKTFFRDSPKNQKAAAAANPIPRILFMGMTMKAWIKYAQVTGAKMKAAKENGYDYIPSVSEEEEFVSEDSDSNASKDNESDYMDEEDERIDRDSVIQEEEEEELQNDITNTEHQSLIDESRDKKKIRGTELSHNIISDKELFEVNKDHDAIESYDLTNQPQPQPHIKNLNTGNKITVIPRPIKRDANSNNSLPQASPLRNVRFGFRDEGFDDHTRLSNFLDAERSPINLESNKTSHSNIGEAEIPSITINNNVYLNGRGSVEGVQGGLTPIRNVNQGKVRHQDSKNKLINNSDSKETSNKDNN